MTSPCDGFFFGGIRNDDTAGRLLLGLDGLDDDAVMKRTKRFYPETKEFAASWLFIMNSRDVTAGSPTPDVTFDIGSATRDFVETRVTTSTVSYTDSAATLEWADTYADRTLHSNIAEKALEYGLATRSELEAIAASWHAWGQDPDALWCFSHTEMVAQKR
jgi:hypothetical protein